MNNEYKDTVSFRMDELIKENYRLRSERDTYKTLAESAVATVKEQEQAMEYCREQFKRLEVSNGIYGVDPKMTVDLTLSRFEQFPTDSACGKGETK